LDREVNFTREITIKPAYDCLKVQPCVHGSEKCGTVPGHGHGRHNAEMWMSLYNDESEVVLVIGTNWFRPETPLSVQLPEVSKGRLIEFHSTTPQYEGHYQVGSGSDGCPRGWKSCFADYAYGAAEEGWEALVCKGSDADWEWLEGIWQGKFGGAE
jgi:hypothetical protein